MRLATFALHSDSAPRLGLLSGDHHIIDLTRTGAQPPFDPTDMVSLIAVGDPALDWLRALSAKSSSGLALADVRLLAPIRPRKNIFCVGWNYLEHFEEGKKNRPANVDLPEHPVFFSKAPNAVNGPYDAIPYDPTLTQTLDWEIELGVVISKGGKNLSEDNAMKHVFGYTVINDVSARDVQRRHGGQWLKGKSLDGTCPMGPWIVTADELDAGNLQLVCRLNGVVKQESSTSYMYFKIPRLIAELSLGLTLEAGDVISTGTPPGVGAGRTPPEYMKSGDVLESEIIGIGKLRNPIGG